MQEGRSSLSRMKFTVSGGNSPEIPLDFDYQATTPCAPEVVEVMKPYWNDFWGNASNRQTRAGTQASAATSLAREKLANCLNVKPDRLIFTSGATEANNLALLGHARAKALKLGKPGHLITVSTEHHSVRDPLRQLQREGFSLTELMPNSQGILSAEKLSQAFKNDTILVSVMFANNEIGVVQPLAELQELCHKRGIILHTDAAQAFGQLNIDFHQLGADLLTISAHKIYGPKGIGALVMRENVPILPLQWGGGQEQGFRPGTLALPLIVGFAKAAELSINNLMERQTRLRFLRDQLWEGLQQKIPALIINGTLENRLATNLNFTVLGIRGHRLHRALRPFLNCSSGSACSNGEPSHVLKAIGRTSKEAESSLRLSLGRETTIEQVNKAIDIITKVVLDLRKA